MTYGIRDIRKAAMGNEIVRCNYCWIYLYDEIIDERDDNALMFIWDDKYMEFFKGCPKCRSDDYLTDIEEDYLVEMQRTFIPDAQNLS